MCVKEKRGTGERMASGSKTLPKRSRTQCRGTNYNYKVRLKMLD